MGDRAGVAGVAMPMEDAMPEFESLLSFGQKLRLAIPFNKPARIGGLMAEIANMRQYDIADITRIYAEVDAAVLEVYGTEGQAVFRAAFERRVRRR